MGLTLSRNKVAGAIIVGRTRDHSELEATGLPIWSSSTGICAANEVAYPAEVDVALESDVGGEGRVVKPGDVVLGDRDGVVVIPSERVSEVLEMLPKLREQDEKVREAILGGMSTGDAFKLRKM